jgi:FkbM family methyltransferase
MIKLERVGTNYGGWVIPDNLDLEFKTVYSAGVGEDISFDLLLHEKYNCDIFLIDPTERSKKHFNEIVDFYKSGAWIFSGDIQAEYKEYISNLKPDFSKFNFLDIGLWDKTDVLKFFKQENKKYVSQTFIDNMFGTEFDEVNVDTIKNIMIKNQHSSIDLLKLDIEGAEVKVLNNMLDDKICPKYLCVEFDLFLKGVDKSNETKSVIQRLIDSKYKILSNENLNITFMKHE